MKKLYLLIICLTSVGEIYAQQNFAWAKREGLYAYDYALGIACDTSGNVYAAGKYEMSAIFSGNTLTCAGNHDMWVARYSPAGALTWLRTAGGPNGDYAHALACNGTHVFAAGEIEGYGDLVTFPGSTITLNAIGDNDVLLAKYDLMGNLQWAHRDGGFYSEKADGVSADNAGNVFVGGHYIDTAKFGGVTTLYGSGGYDIFVEKYNANGVFQWVRKAGGTGRDEVKGVKCDAAGNVYVCGLFSNGAQFGAQTYTTVGNYDAFLAKYDSNGNLVWFRKAGSVLHDIAWSVTIDKNGLIYIAGEFNASIYFGATQLITAGNSDVFVTCYDASGNVVWAKRGGGNLFDVARGIGTDGNKLYITGQFGSTANFGAYSVTAADSSDVFFASLSNTGTFLNALSVGGPADGPESLGYESGSAICADTIGNVYAGGSILDGGVFGATTYSPYARTDAFVTKVTEVPTPPPPPPPNTISENTLDGDPTVYPNPNNGSFTIDLKKYLSANTEVRVYNCIGEKVCEKTNISVSKLSIDLQEKNKGLYFLEIKQEGKTVALKKIAVHP
jgi:hypothetical protein